MENNNDYLAHHGIKGQKWGVIRTPEELGHKSKTSKKKTTAKDIKNAVNKALEKKRKEISKATEERRKEVAKKKAEDVVNREEKLKAHLRKHPGQIYKHRNELKKSDVDELMKQVEWDRKCKDIRRNEFMRGLQKIQDISTTVNTMSNLINSSVNAYNNTALVINAFYDVQTQRGKSTGKLKKFPRVAWGKEGAGGAFFEGNKKAPDGEGKEKKDND